MFHEFEYENIAVFERLADNIYSSKEAGVREAIQNSITAVKNSDVDYGVINIKIKDKGEYNELMIEDNGLGISRDVLDNVLTVVGKSTNKDDGTVAGKFGMGFLALYKLVGTDGGFMMHTRSRETGEDIKGFWKPGGFEECEDVPDILEGEYGTAIKIETVYDELRTAVEKHSEWSRVPIRVEYYEDNKLVSDNEYYKPNIHFDNDAFYDMYISNDLFDCYIYRNGDNVDNTFLLHNSPIKYDLDGASFKYGFNTILRIKNEEGAVIDDNIIEEEVRLPEPVGTREKLNDGVNFLKYIESRLVEDIYQTLDNYEYESLTDIDEYVFKLIEYIYKNSNYDPLSQFDDRFGELYEQPDGYSYRGSDYGFDIDNWRNQGDHITQPLMYMCIYHPYDDEFVYSDDIDNINDGVIDILTKNDYNVICTDLDLSVFDHMTHISNIDEIISKHDVINYYKSNNEDELDTYMNTLFRRIFGESWIDDRIDDKLDWREWGFE